MFESNLSVHLPFKSLAIIKNKTHRLTYDTHLFPVLSSKANSFIFASKLHFSYFGLVCGSSCFCLLTLKNLQLLTHLHRLHIFIPNIAT